MITAGAVPGLREMPDAMSARCPQGGSGPDANADVLAAWARGTARRPGQSPGGGLKFAFSDGGTVDEAGAVHVTAPADAASLIDQLRGSGAVLTYDPDTRTIRARGHHAAAVTTGLNRRQRPNRQP